MIMKKLITRRGAGRPSFLENDTDKSYLMELLANMRVMAKKVVEHLQVHIGKSRQETRKATTVERKIAELIKLIEKF